MLAVGSVVLAGLGATGAVAAEASTAFVVTGHSGWYTQAYENFSSGGYLTPQQADVAGPQRAPFGSGSHKMTIGESSAQTELYRTDAYDGVLVSDLTRLEYSTLARRVSGTGDRQPTYLRLSVDTDGDGDSVVDDSLFFFPANNGSVVNGQWQHWDVSAGLIDVDGDNGGEMSLEAFADAHPDAKLVNAPYDDTHDAGAISLITGGSLGGDTDPQTNGEYFVDRVIVGAEGKDTLFDLGSSTETAGATTRSTVDPGHDQGWKHQAYENSGGYLTSNQAFVDGTSPVGGGSLRFALSNGSNPDRVELFRTTQYDGTLVRDFETMKYSTFQKADAGNTTPQQPVYLRLSVDTDGDGGTDDTLFFYPANNGNVAQSTWQNWDAAQGVWGVDGDPGQAGSITLQDYVVAHPDAKIVVNGDPLAPTQPKGGVAFLVGGAVATQMNGEYFLDNITIGKLDDATGSTYTSKVFDLEPTAPTLAIKDARVSEGNSGAKLAFPVTLSRAVARPVTVRYATSDASAKAGSDYRATSGTVTIPVGSTSATVTVVTLADKVREADERVNVTLRSPGNATVSDATAIGTIINDDTRVAIEVQRATKHRVRANVATVSAVPGAPVKIYSVTKSGTRLLSTELNRYGRISALLSRSYQPGTKVTVYATVKTTHGLYASPRATVTVRR
jgi:hypothetical protein